MLEKLKIHLEDSFKVEGDIIDFRVYDGSQFTKIVNMAEPTAKRVIGLETFFGLNPPSEIDLKHHNTNEIKKGQYAIHENATRNFVDRSTKYKNYLILKTNYKDLDKLELSDLYCFALIDLKQYSTTKAALDHTWDRINYGGTIFINNFDEGYSHSQFQAVKEFLAAHTDDISASRQMIVNGAKERFLAIKCYNQKFKPLNFKDFHSKKKVTIATVLRTGGEVYDYKYVNALARAVKDNVTIDHEFVVLTDNPAGFCPEVDRTIPFIHNFPKWWGKIELFNPATFNTDSVFYMDLDTSIVGNIDDVVSYDGVFAGLRDFYALHSLGSGVMAWQRDKVARIYDRFLPTAQKVMNNYAMGDQVWIDENKPSVEYLQDVYHRKIVSFKRHCHINNQIFIPEHARIVCFHGNPRPHMVQHDILKKYWIDK
jgi:hypothetical protein